VAAGKTPFIPLNAWVAAVGLAAVMVFGSALSFLQNQRAEQLAVSVAETYRGLAELDTILPLVSEMEDDLRMFLATGDRQFLSMSEQARIAIDGHVRAYEVLANGDTVRRAATGELRRRLRERELAIGATAQAYLDGGSAAALDQIRSGRGRAAIEALDEQLRRMKQRDRDELSVRVTAAQRAARLAAWAPVATATAALLILALALRALRRAARVREDAESRLAVLADSVPVIVWNTRADGTNAFVNRAWFEYTGLAPGTPVDAVWADVVHRDDLPLIEQQWAAARRAGAPVEYTYRLRRHDGVYRWFLGRVVPQHTADGRIVQWFGTASDIEEEKEAARLLREQQALLRDADRRKDEFIATLAHELRNPLAPIRNAATVLRQPAADARAREWASAVIQRQVATMALLLDDLLDVSRITRGTLTLHRQSVPLASVVDSAVEIARPALDARGHRLTITLPEGPLQLDVDALRLSQVIANLLTNAAKYTDPGGAVLLAVEAREAELRVTVRDTGIGLAPESLQHIFRMFSQVRGSLDRSEGGLGIGLALVKGLVELHGGRVEAYSEGEGKGSEFRVILPGVVTRPQARAVEAPAAVPSRGSALRIVVADDSRDGAESLAMLLALDGHDVRIANDGTSALELLRAIRPDVALLDIGMPGMNGYEIARAVRNEPWRPSTRLVAITGWGQDEDRRRALESGFDVHLTKPIAPELLANVVRPPHEELRRAQ
jgi:PAS domain S-box-containing protein